MTLRTIILATTCVLMPIAAHPQALIFPAGATLTASRSAPLASALIPLSVYAEGKVKMAAIQGDIRSEAWKISDPALTTLQILDPLRQQLQDDGYEIVLDCKDRECGGFDFRYEIDLMPEPDMHVDLGDFRYLTARKFIQNEPPEYVGLMISRSAATGFVQLTRAEKPGESDQIVVASTKSTATVALSTPQLAGLLETVGRAPLEDLTFAIGSSSLGQETFESLVELAAYLAENPEMTVALVGHTDSKGSNQANLLLSRKRATSVMNRLISAHDIPRRQLEADGVGYLSPRASNITEEGRTQNRRVEVILTSTQ